MTDDNSLQTEEESRSGQDTDTVLDDTTTSTSRRWEWLGTLSSAYLIGSLPAHVYLHSAGMIDVTSVPDMWFAVYAVSVVTAVVWTFGKSAFNSARDTVSSN